MDIVPESCRLCLSAREPTFPIYERLSLVEITELLQDTLGIQISNSEEFTNICNVCETKSKLLFNIAKEFRQADQLFCSFLNQKRSAEGLPLLEENKDAIQILTVIPLEPIPMEELRTEITETVPISQLEQNPDVGNKELVYEKPVDSAMEEDPANDHHDPDVPLPEQSGENPSTSKLLTCYVCKGFSGTEPALGTHLKEQHNSLLPYYCERCLVRFEDMMAINYHFQSHEFPYGCLFCEDLFSLKSELDTHSESCLGYQCSYCLNFFQFVHSLQEHDCESSNYKQTPVVATIVDSLHNQDQLIPQVCGLCSEDFGNNQRLAHHFETKHENCQMHLISCDMCPKKFTVLMAARHHRSLHMMRESAANRRKSRVYKRYECTICLRGFEYNKDLLAHIDAEHVDSRVILHQCKKCQQKFTTKFKLRAHFQSAHNKPEFFCAFCNRLFRIKTRLKDHENTHRGISEYNCNECTKVFTYKSSYVRHMQLIHSVIEEFICDYCNLSFKRKEALMKHIRVHIGEKSTDASTAVGDLPIPARPGRPKPLKDRKRNKKP